MPIPSRHAADARPPHGLTLMEGMTVIGVMTIVLVMVSQIFAVSYDIFIKQMARTDNETGAVLAARTISEMARGAEAIETSRTIGATTYTTDGDTLVLRLPSVDSSNNVVPGSYDYVAFERDATETEKIFVDTDAAAGSKRIDLRRLLTDNNEVLAFRYNAASPEDADRVQVYLVNRQTVRQTTITTRGWTAIFLRNY